MSAAAPRPLTSGILRSWPWAAAVASGILMALCFAPFDRTWLGWIALAPVTAALWLSDGPHPHRRALSLGYVTGLVFFWTTFHWITTVTSAGWFALAFYLALYPALWGWFTGIVARPRILRPVPANVLEKTLRIGPPVSRWLGSGANLKAALLSAAAWVALEWLRGIVFTGFGWNALGVALHKDIAFLQLASLTGVGGLSFLLVLSSATLVFTVARLGAEMGRAVLRPHYDFNLAVALVVCAFSYGIHRVQNPPATRPVRVAAVQPNIPQDNKWDPALEESIITTLRDLTESALAAGPDLVLWPESATPRPLLNDHLTFDFVRRFGQESGVPLLLGSIDVSDAGAFNIAALFTRKAERMQVYRKIHLVPFGEFIPFRRSFPLFAWIAGGLIPTDFDPGTEFTVMDLEEPPVRFAALVCFEDTLGRLVRHFLPGDPQLLVNVTNDGWFLQSAAAEQHLANAVFRTVETGLPMVRCANTGVTCIIDTRGRITSALREADGSHFLRGVLLGKVEVPVRREWTFYGRFGEWFSILALLASLSAVALRLGIQKNRP